MHTHRHTLASNHFWASPFSLSHCHEGTKSTWLTLLCICPQWSRACGCFMWRQNHSISHTCIIHITMHHDTYARTARTLTPTPIWIYWDFVCMMWLCVLYVWYWWCVYDMYLFDVYVIMCVLYVFVWCVCSECIYDVGVMWVYVICV